MSTGSSGAQTIYQHQDQRGTIHLTNRPRGAPFSRRELPGSEPGPPPAKGEIRQAIHAIARDHQVDPLLAEAVAIVESSLNPQAVSHAGAMGVMQLMPATADRFRVGNPFDARENIRGGVEYLAWLLREFSGDLTKVLAGYHAGEQRVHRHNGIPPIPATRQYVSRTLKTLDRLEREHGRSRGIQQHVDQNGVIHLSNRR